jgi:PAS domain S-box-containing protein
MYGYSSSEMIGRSALVLAPPDRSGEIQAFLARLKAGESVDHFETVRVSKEGSPVRVSINVSPIHDEEGVVVGASSIARDMTQARKAVEAARSMIESSLDSLVAISPEGMITDVNEATVKVTGLPREELVGTAFSDCFTDPGRADRIYQLVFEKGMAVDYPLAIRHRDGTLTSVLYNASAYRDGEGNVLGAFAAARDVTKQMQAQRENAQQQASEREQLIELQQFQRLTIGRELAITELRKENERLRALLPTGGAEGDDQR